MGQNLTFVRTSGSVPRSLPNEDHVSGIVFLYGYTPPDTPSFSLSPKLVSNTDTFNDLFISYVVNEFFKRSPNAELYVIQANIDNTDNFIASAITELAQFAKGRIRQTAVVVRTRHDVNEVINECMVEANVLADNAMPMSIVLGVNRTWGIDFNAPDDFRQTGAERISIVAGYDLSYDNNSVFIGNAGAVLGLISKAAVHESIAWVQKFNTNIAYPGIMNIPLSSFSKSELDVIDAYGYLYFRTYPGIAGSYMNDSHTLALPTSEFSKIEAVRTMDKVERGIRTYLTPYLGAPLYVDAETGKLRADTVAFIETLAGRQLEDMEKAGELSGYKVEVDPNQNVLSTSTVEIVVKQVAVGVMRRINVKLSYATQV